MNKIFFVPALATVFFIIPAAAGAANPTMCTMQYQPVCGAKQVQCIKAPCYPVYHTYGNSCTMNAENGTFIHEGECTAAESGPVTSTQPYTPPSNCTAWFDGCNSCSRTENGQSMCTERACAGTPAAGYCTAYKKPGVLNPPSVLSASTSVDASSSTQVGAATGTMAAEGEVKTPGFIQRLWQSILSWFSWL